MAFKKENKIWKLRSKHGRNKLFASPKLMWEAATEYFQWCDDNPFMKAEAKVVSNGQNSGSSIELIEVPVKRPYTIQGLCAYLCCNSAYFRTFKSQNKNKARDFNTVIANIEETLYDNKFSGAASGFFNANIIARDLGLKEYSETEVKTVVDFKDAE